MCVNQLNHYAFVNCMLGQKRIKTAELKIKEFYKNEFHTTEKNQASLNELSSFSPKGCTKANIYSKYIYAEKRY